ncbi:MAG: DUF4168 domain-containing protein [Vicinamibacterales bacterium]
MHPFDHTRRSSRAVAFGAAVAMTLGLLAPAFAQQTPAQPPAPSQQSQPAPPAQPQPPPAADATQKPTITSAQVPDAEVEQFARAAGHVLKIQAEIKEKLVEATNPETKEQLQQEANVRILETIKENGLEVERFNLIARSMNSDAELGRRVSAKMQELQKQAAL